MAIYNKAYDTINLQLRYVEARHFCAHSMGSCIETTREKSSRSGNRGVEKRVAVSFSKRLVPVPYKNSDTIIPTKHTTSMNSKSVALSPLIAGSENAIEHKGTFNVPSKNTKVTVPSIIITI
uniref:Uncharacterized protein n=1 Tax=Babesia bovis TaxID=5865 RepID=S6B5V3_BABBO|nr:hypothetical protein [Babesia bovis]